MVVYYCISLLHWLHFGYICLYIFDMNACRSSFVFVGMSRRPTGVPPYFNVHIHRESGESIPVVPEVPSKRIRGTTEVRTFDFLIQLMVILWGHSELLHQTHMSVIIYCHDITINTGYT